MVEVPATVAINNVELNAAVDASTPEITTDDYSALANKPSINGNVLIGDKSTEELGIEHVKFADNLIANSGVTSSSPYLFRKSPQNVSAELHRLVGGTVAWNQLLDTSEPSREYGGITLTNNGDGSWTVNGTATANGSIAIRSNFSTPLNHVFFINGCPSGGSISTYFIGFSGYVIDKGNGGLWKNTTTYTSLTARFDFKNGVSFSSKKFWPCIIDLTQMFGSTVADAILAMETATAGSGVAFFRSLFPSAYYPYSAPTLASVQTSARVTRGFNQWDEEWRNGTYSNSTGAYTASSNYFANANPIPVIPGEQYNLAIGDNSTMRFLFYGEYGAYLSYTDKTASDSVFTVPTGAVWMNFCGTTTNYGSVYKHDICINLSDTSRNGQYQPYKAKSYPIDDVVLRGIPKLTNGVLSYDGDIYLPTGEVTRKYAEVDLGSLTWTYNSTNAYFYASMPTDSATVVAGGINGVCGKYLCTTISSADFYASDKVLTYCNANMSSSKRVFVRDTAYTDATAFKTAVTGSKLVYILATPTTDQADPYSEIQSAGETEQFVSESVVPVGNEAFYPEDLTGVVQNLAPLPTSAGEYKLKVTVTGGVPSYSWVAG